jgi:Uncharacterized protein involved in biosynthesis of c-type cytochromes
MSCVVWFVKNQTIADSNADLAKDLRRQVYEMLEKGQTRDEIVDFMIQRYGDFVMYNPQFKAKTGVLWVAPFIFLLVGFILVWFMSRRKKCKKTVKRMISKKHNKLKSENYSMKEINRECNVLVHREWLADTGFFNAPSALMETERG